MPCTKCLHVGDRVELVVPPFSWEGPSGGHHATVVEIQIDRVRVKLDGAEQDDYFIHPRFLKHEGI